MLGKIYWVQHWEKECGNCRYIDSIKEKVDPKSQCRCKIKLFVCQIDHKQIETTGICDIWEEKQ